MIDEQRIHEDHLQLETLKQTASQSHHFIPNQTLCTRAKSTTLNTQRGRGRGKEARERVAVGRVFVLHLIKGCQRVQV